MSDRMMDDQWAQLAMEKAADETREWMGENVGMGGVCDFCSEPLKGSDWQTWTTEVSIISTIHGLAYAEDGSTGAASQPMHYSPLWAACPKCDPVVAERSPALLADHIIGNAGLRAPQISGEAEAVFRAELIELYEVFFERARRLNDRWFSPGARITEP